MDGSFMCGELLHIESNEHQHNRYDNFETNEEA